MACLAATALMLAGCGSSSSGTVSATAYVTSVCKAIGPFEREIASGSAALDPSPASSAAQRKRMLEGFLTTIASDSRLAVGELKSAKQPAVENGAKLARRDGFVKKGDEIVVVAGVPFGQPGTTNALQVTRL